MFGYAATIFVSAFLLFQVQPMAARFVLPWFGGTSLVWTTCMLFFQIVLVLGYGWSHFINRHLSPRRQWILHSLVLITALATLPIRPGDEWKPVDGHMATWRLLLLLAASVGLPYFLVSTTGPLIQAWQSVTHPGKSPFRLFALSNFASLAALVTYPLLYERYLTLNAQSWTWTCGFILFAILVSLSGYRFVKTSESMPEFARRPAKDRPAQRRSRIGLTPLLLWVLLPALASVTLLSTTNMLTQEVGAVPFLWVIPLALYLLSFIISFDHPFWYFRPFFMLFMCTSVAFGAVVMNQGVEAKMLTQIIGYSALCFGVSMCCHGELSRLKPDPEHLTFYYLLISIGGALGGVFVAIVAPAIFVNYYEFPLSVIAALAVVLIAYGWQLFSKLDEKIRMVGEGKIPASIVGRQWPGVLFFALSLFIGMIAAGITGIATWKLIRDDRAEEVLLQCRNEYGTLTVEEWEYTRQLTNGRIKHGFQYKDDRWSRTPTSYYGPSSGLGVAVEYLRESTPPPPVDRISFGAIGLGVGTVCAWCEKGDFICFYEINPRVVDIARTWFRYLAESPEEPVIRLGDARIQLEREIEEGNFRLYDILVVDAFSSDSIPVHLLTREAMQTYLHRMTDRGILCIHTSNRFLQLANVVRVLADEQGVDAVFVDDDTDDNAVDSSSWVLVSRNREFIEEMKFLGTAAEWPDETRVALWTDDYSSIIPLIKWDSGDNWWDAVLDTIGLTPES